MGPRLSLDLIKLGVALLGIAALGAWFVRTPPEATEPSFDRPGVTAILVDTSASVTRARKAWRRWAVRTMGEEARAAGARGEEVALVTFDSVVARRAGPIGAEAFFELMRKNSKEWLDPSGVDTATDLARAARTAAAMLGEAGRAPGSIVVLGDGVPTGEDPSAILLRDPLWTLRLVEPPPPSSVDLGVVRTISPRRVAPEVAVPIELDLALVGPAVPPGTRVVVEWSLQLTGTDVVTRGRQLDGPGGAEPGEGGLFLNGTKLSGSAEVEVPETACRVPQAATRGGAHSSRSFRARFKVPGQKVGSASLRARVRLAGVVEDPFPENDVATAEWTVGDPLRVLVCAPWAALGSATAFFNGASFDGIEFVGVAPEALATALEPASGERPDAVVTIELALASLPAEALRTFVEEWGGGWMHAAGWPLTRTDGGPLAELAALEPDVDPKPPRDIVFMVDGSGSMEGERWSSMRTALRKLVPRVPATDTLSLRFFTGAVGAEQLRLEAVGSGELSPAMKASRNAQINHLLRLDVPGGATNIVQSLWGLATARASREHTGQLGPDGQPLNDGLVILVSDGESQSLRGRRKTTRAKIADGRDDLVILHVGGERGVRFLKGLLLPGEEVVLVDDLSRLVDRMREAILDLQVVEGARLTAVPELPQRLVEPWRSTLEAVLERVPSAEPVVIQGAIPSRPTTGAVALASLVSESLTLAGRTATFAAAAERGRGLTVGLAAPLVEADADRAGGAGLNQWASALRYRSGWLAPFFRDAARRRSNADRELVGEDSGDLPTAVWLHDPKALLGADTRWSGPALWIDGLAVDGPTDLVVEFRGGATLDLDGQRDSGVLLTRVGLEFAPSTVEPRAVRVVQVPADVQELPAGTEVSLVIFEADSGGQAVAGPIRLVAPGPVEATSFGVGRVAAAFGAQPASAVARQASRLDGDRPGSGKGRRGHPLVAGLLICGLVAIFAGAALQTRRG